MSDLTRRASDRFLTSLEQAEADMGPRYAGEIAEAHVDAGARYLDGERVGLPEDEERYVATLPTALALQNQI